MLKRNTVAVIDVGSNSIKLLVAQKGREDESLKKLYSKTIETRISEGISQQNPRLNESAILLGGQSIAALVNLARSYEPETIKIVATSAVRDATNGHEFVKQVHNITGITINVLSGIEEANFIGRGLRCDPLIAQMERFIQMDIGGGSLELIRLNRDSIETVCSLQLGAVRLTEKFIADRTTSVDSDTEATIRSHVLESVVNSGFNFDPTTNPMIVTGGAFSVIRSILAEQSGRQMEVTSPVIESKLITELKKTLCSLSLDERKAIHGLSVARADIMPTALITIDAVLKLSGRETVTQSSYNLRYGIATTLLETEFDNQS